MNNNVNGDIAGVLVMLSVCIWWDDVECMLWECCWWCMLWFVVLWDTLLYYIYYIINIIIIK